MAREPETLALVFLKKFPKSNNKKINNNVTFKLLENMFGWGEGGTILRKIQLDSY